MFRINLHPALFDEFSERGYVETEHFNRKTYDPETDAFNAGTLSDVVITAERPKTQEEKAEEAAETEKNQKEEGGVRLDIQKNTELSGITQEIKSMPNSNQDHLRRFDTRCDTLYENKEKYSVVWEKKINEGFGHLITALTENNYFDDCVDDNAKQAKIAQVKEQYKAEVKKQYKEKILDAKDSKFNAIKDTIFGRESEDYPANKIYCKLTGAASIFTADRTYMQGYGAEILDDAGGDPETMSDRRNRKFLSKDLPKYLWDIRKTPQSMNLLIFKIKVKKLSEKDMDAISNLLKVSSRLNVPSGQDAAVALLTAFKTNKLSANSGIDAYKRVLGEKGISAKKEKYWDDIVKVGNFYFKTQSENNAAEDQHAIYLSVLEIIKTEGGVNNAVQKWKKVVDEANKDKKEEKRDGGYENGETLKNSDINLFDLATKLGISDYTNATRLQKKSPEYFTKLKDNPEKILANINNDDSLSALDTVVGGSKTGQQFIEVFNQVGKETALKNLLERAKLENKALGLGLDENIFKAEEITGGNKKLILLLQNIITKPGEDLLTLLGDKTRVEFDKQFLEKAKERSKEVAKEMAGKVKLDELRQLGLTNLPQPEELQSGLAATLYSEYSKGIGLGSKISFDEWVKGLSMNTGLQVRDDKSVVLGIGLSYKTDVNLGKGWSMTPMFSAGGFIPLGYGSPELAGSGGFSVDVAKKWITDKGVAQKIGFDAGVTVMTTGTVILSTGLSWYRDKLAGIESREQEKRGEMVSLMKSMLDEYFQKLQKAYHETGIKEVLSLNLENPVSRNIMRGIIEANAKELAKDATPDKINTVVNATMRLLLPYQGALNDPEIKDMIAAGVADQYAMAWAEDRKAHISDSTYLSGANLGAFWVVGSPLVGIYAGLRRTDHNLDGYADRWGREYSLDHQYEGGRNEELIKGFNQEAGFRGNDVLSISEVEGKKYIKIPKDLAFRVRVNEKLKGNMKQDAEGNVLLHVQTPMAAKIHRGAATQGSEIIIGGRKGENFSFLDKVGNDWFTTEEINATEILNLGEGIRTYSAEVINKALTELKTKFPAGDKIQKFEIKEDKMKELVDEANKINSKEKPHKVKLIIDEVGGGELGVSLAESLQEGRGLEIEYKAKFEMIDAEAKKVATAVYNEALKLKNPIYLWEVKHTTNGNKPRPEYAPFDNAMQSADYALAKEKIKPIFKKLDEKYKGASHFTEILNQLDKIQDPNALGQALMSIRNVFARAKNVQGLNDRYGFSGERHGMSSIIERRAKQSQIRGTIDKSNMPSEYKTAYLALIDASEKYRIAHPELFAVKEAKAAQLNNTIGFNLGDHTNPENPLFNPEIYNPQVDLKALETLGFPAEQRNKLHQRAMENFAKNPVLLAPILKALGLEGGEVSIGKFEDGKLTLDISKDNVKKQITLKADMQFGYFTQCVNHTVILSNISAEGNDGTSVQFNSGVWENGSYREGNKTSIVSTTEVSVGGAVTLGGHENKPDDKQDNVMSDDATTGGRIQPPTPPDPAGNGTTTITEVGEV